MDIYSMLIVSERREECTVLTTIFFFCEHFLGGKIAQIFTYYNPTKDRRLAGDGTLLKKFLKFSLPIFEL